MKTKWLGLCAVAAALGIASQASAGTFVAQYFDVSNPGGNLSGSTATGDFGFCCSSPPATLPVIALGSGLSGGMPVTTTSSVFEQDPTTHAILWWTPSVTTGITSTGSGAFQLGKLNNMFAPNSTANNDGNLYETAIVNGEIWGTGHDAEITVASDDDSLVYVNGQYVGGLPGVHGTESTTIDLGTLTAGSHDSIEVFYADRAQVGANLLIGVAGAAVPEPATWAMMLMGVGMIGAGLRMARRRNDATLSAA
jgi:fibro-slime domain-containing protein